MFKLIHKNNSGLSLTELLVCLVILALVLPMGYQTLHSIATLNNATIDQWDVQTAAKIASRDFETNKEGLANALQVDLLYDPVVEGGVTIDDAGNITWRDGSATSKTMLPEGASLDTISKAGDVYTYIFSTPTWNTSGDYLGELLYIRDYSAGKSRLLLLDYGLENIPISVTFSVGTTESLLRDNHKYTSNSVVIHFRSGLDDLHYGYDATFSMVNLSRPINYSDGTLVSDVKWINEDSVPVAYTVGWDAYTLNYNNSGNLITDKGFPKAETPDDGTAPYYVAKYDDEDSSGNLIVRETKISETFDMKVYNEDGVYEKTISGAPVIARQGNVLRYKSPAAEKEHSTPKEQISGVNIATCLTGYAMAGSDMADKVLSNIRLFRDNVLRGTEFGDWFIHQYYYVWSPFLIEHTAFLKPVYQAILIPISYVCGFLAKL